MKPLIRLLCALCVLCGDFFAAVVQPLALLALFTRSAASADLRLVHFNLNPEVSAPRGSRGQLGLAFREIQVRMIHSKNGSWIP
jgi:hypothetical protein